MIRPPLSCSFILPTVALFALANCSPQEVADLELDRRAAALVNGTFHNGHPAVGALLSSAGGLCTATLVGKLTVVTAGHCVHPGAQHRFVAGNKYWGVASILRHPRYDERANNDVGVVRLAQAPPLTPASITTVPPERGQRLTLLGYGATNTSGAGASSKRIGKNSVAALTSTRIIISGSGGDKANLCFGDSGGPSFATIDGTDVLVGIHSTIAGSCGFQGHDMRVDVYANWIQAAAEDDVAVDGVPSPLSDQEPPIVQITNPADGARFRGALKVTATASDNTKMGSLTLRVGDTTVGTRTHPPYSFSLELDPGKHVLTVVAEDAVGNQSSDSVEVEVLDPLVFGESCANHAECASGICATQGEESYCTEMCDPEAETGCPDDAACLPAGPQKFACGLPGSALAGDDGASGCAVGGPAAPRGAIPVALLALLSVAALLRPGRD